MTQEQPIDTAARGRLGERLSHVLEEVQAGSDSAAKWVHEKYANHLFVLASRRIGRRFKSKIGTEDIVQSVFATFFRRHGNGEFCFSNWNELWALLAKITVNKCLVKINRLKTAKRDGYREEKNDVWRTIGNQLSPESYAHEVAAFNETLDHLIDQIPTSCSDIVRLRLQWLSNFEISEELDCSERTVYRNLSTVKNLLEDELASTESKLQSNKLKDKEDS